MLKNPRRVLLLLVGLVALLLLPATLGLRLDGLGKQPK